MCVWKGYEGALGRGLLGQVSLVLEHDGGGGLGVQQVLPVRPRLTQSPAPQQQVLQGGAIFPTRTQPLEKLRRRERESKKERG